ncbi:MAG: hypothetical protein U5J63_09970 [Fodinibius sp.]|nr:hypothetical protein [Fodinibius sp.]
MSVSATLAEAVAADHVFDNPISCQHSPANKRPPFPPNNAPPRCPQQMIRNIPFPLALDTLAISDGHIRYSELRAQGQPKWIYYIHRPVSNNSSTGQHREQTNLNHHDDGLYPNYGSGPPAGPVLLSHE